MQARCPLVVGHSDLRTQVMFRLEEKPVVCSLATERFVAIVVVVRLFLGLTKISGCLVTPWRLVVVVLV